jgi:hypothetical protein
MTQNGHPRCGHYISKKVEGLGSKNNLIAISQLTVIVVHPRGARPMKSYSPKLAVLFFLLLCWSPTALAATYPQCRALEIDLAQKSARLRDVEAQVARTSNPPADVVQRLPMARRELQALQGRLAACNAAAERQELQIRSVIPNEQRMHQCRQSCVVRCRATQRTSPLRIECANRCAEKCYGRQ